MKIDRLDHWVLTVRKIERSCAFYERVLGMKAMTFGKNRKALLFGNQKINLHEQGRGPAPRAARPTPGSADLCFLISTPLSEAITALRSAGVEIVEGPVSRTGATGPIRSVYLRDPDGNLIELSNPEKDATETSAL
ncbi:MAG: VOC family protein [Nitrospirae bacterium]|nr:VOC family protein [Candidatus Manganitrophaceae bacterium]